MTTFSYRKARFQVYIGKDRAFYWRLLSAGKVVASGEDFPTKGNTERSIFAVIRIISGLRPVWLGKAEITKDGNRIRKVATRGGSTIFIEYLDC